MVALAHHRRHASIQSRRYLIASSAVAGGRVLLRWTWRREHHGGCRRVTCRRSRLLLREFGLEGQLKSLARDGRLTDFLALADALGIGVAQLPIVNLGGYILKFFRLGEIVCDNQLNELIIREPFLQT